MKINQPTYAMAVIIAVTSGQSILEAIQAAKLPPKSQKHGSGLLAIQCQQSVAWTDPVTSASYTCATNEMIMSAGILDWTAGGDCNIIAYFGTGPNVPTPFLRV